MFAGPPLDYRRWTKTGSQSRTRVRARMPTARGHSALPLPRENRQLSMGFFLSRIVFQFLHTDGSCGSQYRRLIFWYYYVRREDWGSFPAGSSTGPRITSYHLSASPKSHSAASKQQDVQPSLAQPATRPHLLGTNALRCASRRSR